MFESVVCAHMLNTATSKNKETNWQNGGMLGKKKFYFFFSRKWVGRETGNRKFFLVWPLWNAKITNLWYLLHVAYQNFQDYSAICARSSAQLTDFLVRFSFVLLSHFLVWLRSSYIPQSMGNGRFWQIPRALPLWVLTVIDLSAPVSLSLPVMATRAWLMLKRKAYSQMNPKKLRKDSDHRAGMCDKHVEVRTVRENAILLSGTVSLPLLALNVEELVQNREREPSRWGRATQTGWAHLAIDGLCFVSLCQSHWPRRNDALSLTQTVAIWRKTWL